MTTSTPTTRLAVFDIDGTLSDNLAVDDECFTGVAAALLQVDLQPSFWEGAPEFTDTRIVDWLWRRHCYRRPRPAEVVAFRQGYEAALARERAVDPDRFRATPGAEALLNHLSEAGWGVAYATGSWRSAALVKLAAAGLPTDRLLACSDDAADRSEVFALARSRAEAAAGKRFAQVVLVGDGIWDVQVALNHSWGFVGVGRGPRGQRLRASGAQTIMEDFSNLSAAVAALAAATPPHAPPPMAP